MRKYLSAIALLAAVSTGCAATTYKRSYIVGAAAVSFVNEAHSEYDQRVLVQLEKCNPENNADVTTKATYDTCMGDHRLEVQDKIVKALGVLTVAGTAFSAVMQGCEPNADGTKVGVDCVKRVYTNAELRAARGKLITAAVTALEEFPGADAKVRSLVRLVGNP